MTFWSEGPLVGAVEAAAERVSWFSRDEDGMWIGPETQVDEGVNRQRWKRQVPVGGYGWMSGRSAVAEQGLFPRYIAGCLAAKWILRNAILRHAKAKWLGD